MKKPKIVTDITIPQSPLWAQRTAFLDDLAPKSSWAINKFVNLIPMLKPFGILTLILLNVRKYELLITEDIRTAQLFGLIRTFFPIKGVKHFVLILMMDDESSNIIWKIKQKIQQKAFSTVHTNFVSSTEEVDIYSKRLALPKSKFKFVHFHTDVIEPRIVDCPNGYVLSAGQTGRDFHVFLEAIKDLPFSFKIISDEKSANGLSVGDNTQLLVDIPRDDYIDCLENCKFVVVPLKNLNKSTGQIVILEAMSLGKPVIATDTVGTRDYISPGFSGLLVPPNDPVSLRNTIIQLANDASMQRTLSRNAFSFVMKNCTFDAYVTKILGTVEGSLLDPEPMNHFGFEATG